MVCVAWQKPSKISKLGKKYNQHKKRITAAPTAATLAATITVFDSVVDVLAIRVSSYKGSALDVGERSGLIIGASFCFSTVNDLPNTAYQ